MNIYRGLLCASFFPLTQTIRTLASIKRHTGKLYMKNPSIKSVLYNPKSENQKKYLNLLNDNNCKLLLSTGPAGTGKTIFACQKAILQLKNDEISKIVITRPVVTVEEDIGFLPGNLNKKMDPWVRPIFDLFLEYYTKGEIDALLNNNKIEICPLLFMRGRTFKNAFIIADEMQNSSPNQMKMLTTRIGENSKMIITGDLHQTDIVKENGLSDLITRLRGLNNSMISHVTLNNSDVERSEVVKKIVELYDSSPITKNTDTSIVSESSLNNTTTIVTNNSTNSTNSLTSNDNTNNVTNSTNSLTSNDNTNNVTNGTNSTASNNNTNSVTNGTNITQPVKRPSRPNGSDDAALIPYYHYFKNKKIE